MSEFIEFLSPKAQSDLDKANASLLQMISNVEVINKTMAGVKTPSGSDSAVKQLNEQYRQQEATIKSLQEKLNRLSQIQNTVNNNQKRGVATSREQSVANQILRAETDRNFRSTTLLGGAYAKASAQLLVLKKEAKDAAITFGEQSVQAKRAAAAANELGGRVTAADKVVGDYQRNVGNYSNGVIKGFQGIFANVRQLAYILPGIGIAGIFGLIGEGIMKIFTKTNDALDKFKENVTDLVSTTTEKASTLKTVSQVINDTKTSQEQFNYALKLAQQEGITLNAIEAARKGNLELINKELTDQIDISIKKAKADKLVNLITENEIEQTKNLRKEKESYNSWYRSALRTLGKGSKDFALIEAGINKSSLDNIAELKRENEEYYKMLKELGLENLLDEEKKAGQQKERIRNNYAEAESLFNLRIARLEELRLLQKEIQDNESATDYGRLEARKEYSRLSLEILEEQFAKENALADLKFKEDLEKANEVYLKNKKNGFDDVQNAEEYKKAIADITARYNNEKELSDINYSRKFKENAYSDAEFNEKVLKATFEKEEKYRKKTIEETDKLNEQINKSNQKKYQKIANDESKTLKARQLAFDEYKNLALLEIQIEQQKALAKADPSEYDTIIQKYKDLKEGIENLKTPLDIANEATKSFIRGFQTDFINKGLEELGLNSLKIFLDIDENGQSTFDKLMEGAKTWEEELKVAFLSSSEIIQDVFNIISQGRLNDIQDEKRSLETKRKIAIAFANGDENAIAEIERQAEQRRKELARREFQAKKEQALFNIAIDTAQAIMATLGKTGFFGIPLTFIVGALGAAQAIKVASQQPPEFWEGGTHTEGGLLKMNDDPYNKKGGNYKEVALTPDGKVYKPQGKNVVANFPKGTEIFKDYATFDAFMFNQDLSNMMQSSGIGMSDSKPQIDIRQDLHQLGKDVVSAINNKTEYHQTFDNNGINNYISNGHTRKQIKNNHVTFTKQSY